jgi:hypothetical protein
LIDAARAFCVAHNALPENAVYGTQIAEFCYRYARLNPGIVEQMRPDKVNGRFNNGALICDRGYYRGVDHQGYIKEGPCIPVPEIEGGSFQGHMPLTLRCDAGYVYAVDRAQTPDNLVTPDEMHCVKVPPEKATSRNKCPQGTIAIAAMSSKDRSRYPYGAQCAK